MRGEQLPADFAAAELAFTDVLASWERYVTFADPAEVMKSAPQIIEELDAVWPYTGLYCTFSGNGVYPVPDEDGGVEVRSGEYAGEGFSRGFTLYDFDGGGRLKLYHAMLMERVVEMAHPVATSERRLYAYVDTAAVVTPTIELESALVPEMFSDLPTHEPAQIFAASELLVSIYRSTTFRRMGHRQQQQLVGSYLRSLEAGFDLRQSKLLIQADYCCRPTIRDNVLSHDIVPLNQGIIDGVCLGISSLEEQGHRSKAIRRDADMFSRNAGLCLVVEVQEASLAAQVEADQVVFVPLSDQMPELYIYTQDVA